jgi:pimeloyl-ACP methyl ester carboxylesterase
MRTRPVESSIDVPGARLRYVTQGSGPVLLLVAGGHGDASKSQALAAHLAGDYTVVTHDRRGLSGSVGDLPCRSVAAHAEDASRVLAEVTDEPAYVYGTSLGGLIALALASRHPEQVAVVVAHEPGAVSLLPTPEREAAVAEFLAVERAFVDDGVDAALQRFAQLADVDPHDRESDVEPGARTPQEAANMAFFVRNDLPVVREHTLDLDGLRHSSVRVVPAVGATSAQIWPHRCGRLLAEALGLPTETLPGGHLGYVQRPRGTAERLREVFDRQGHPSR